MKQSAVYDATSSLRPNAFVINETKSTSTVASRIQVKGYMTYKSQGVRTEGKSKTGKWGVIVGIEDSLHAQRVEGFCHRFIGLYGEFEEEEASNFWRLIIHLCQQAPYSWSIEGDCNATTSSVESTGENYRLTHARRQYADFLRITNGKDLWMEQPDRNATNTFTYKGPFGQSIIDRMAHSTVGVLGGSIAISKVFIPATDPRAIVASIALCASSILPFPNYLLYEIPANPYRTAA
ncbi:hypothetical protein R3P38DRAFT_3204496 [Favolaschia claudopus]|uniref:Uncharacterized protein n=1 Tax=Favolaschia claudopus TaxID=2862362 RepID=A0AAW0AR43_9AGAR